MSPKKKKKKKKSKEKKKISFSIFRLGENFEKVSVQKMQTSD